MANELSDVVRVVIFDQTTAIATASFQIPLILAQFEESEGFPERARVYNNIQALAEDFDPASEVYTIASKLFGQSGVLGAPIPSVVVGRRDLGEDIVAALAEVEQANDGWYCVVSDTKDPVEQEALSDAIQAREKIYGLSTSDSAAITASETDIAAKLSNKSAARTFGVYLPTADTEYPEAAWVGSQLAVTPGQNDWDFKRANGVTVSRLSATAIANLKAKNCNYYISKGGVNIFQNGDMFNGQPIDTSVGKDWLTARIQEAVYFRMINILKIPMTDAGLLIIENEIRSVLAQAETNTLIDSGWTVSTPPVSSIPATLRAERAAGVFVIRARLAGAVRFVDIEIFLSV